MNYTMTNDDLFAPRPSLLGRVFKSLFSKPADIKRSPYEIQIDGLRADNAIAMDQCLLMKKHILELESKIEQLNSVETESSENEESDTPYSDAIDLVKSGSDKSEIQGACGLTESEADLIMTLYDNAHNDVVNS